MGLSSLFFECKDVRALGGFYKCPLGAKETCPGVERHLPQSEACTLEVHPRNVSKSAENSKHFPQRTRFFFFYILLGWLNGPN